MRNTLEFIFVLILFFNTHTSYCQLDPLVQKLYEKSPNWNTDSLDHYFIVLEKELLDHSFDPVVVTKMVNSIDRFIRRYPSENTTIFISQLINVHEQILANKPLSKIYLNYALELSFYHNKEYRAADSVFQYSLKPLENIEIERNETLGNAYYVAGLAKRRLSNTSGAYNNFIDAWKLHINSKNPNFETITKAIYWAARMARDMGDFNESRSLYNECIKVGELKFGKFHISTLQAYGSLGLLYRMLGNVDKAIENYQIVVKILQESGLRKGQLASTYMNLGVAYKSKQAYEDALKYYAQAMKLFADLRGAESREVAKIYQNQAVVYFELGLYNESIELEKKALQIVEKLYSKNDPEVASLLNNIGNSYFELQDYSRSEAYLLNSYEIYLFNGVEYKGNQATILNSLGDLHTRKEEFSEALKYHFQAAEIQNELYDGLHSSLAYSYNAIGSIYLQIEQYEQALHYIDKALSANCRDLSSDTDDLTQFLNHEIAFESYLLKGKIYGSASELEQRLKAVTQFKNAEKVITYQRNILFDKSDKITLARNVKRLTNAEMSTFLILYNKTGDHGYLTAAYETSERSKSQVLRRSIEKNNAIHFAGIPDSVLVEKDDLQSKINFYENRVHTETDKLKKENYESQLFNLRESYRGFESRLKSEFPAYYKLQFQDNQTTLQSIQDKLGGEEAALSYVIGNGGIYRLLLWSDGINLDQVLIEEEGLKDHIVGLRKSITLDINEVYQEKAYELFQLLIPSTIPDQIKKIIIIPDDGLAQVPFETLITRAVSTEELNSWNLPYFLKSYEVSYAPSLSLWFDLKNKNNSTTSQSLLAYAPVFINSENDQPEEPAPDYITQHEDAYPLPATKREVEKIDSLFSNKDYFTTTYMYSSSSEKSLLSSSLSSFDYLHFATHGFVNEVNPDLSGLLLARGSAEDYDNILYSGEVYNLKLNAKLVSLSACETGLGKIAEGEGLLGFTQAFFYAGTKNLMYSLWKINDDSSAKFMVKFYGYIIDQNLSLSTSLRKAKLELINSEDYSHPYYWAPFILTGA